MTEQWPCGLEVLCADLVSGDETLAERAALKLPELGSQAMAVVCGLYETSDSEARWWVIRALAGFETTMAIPGSARDETTSILLTALSDDSEELRQAAAMAFCHRPDPQALTKLAYTLNDPDPMTAKLASNALILLEKQATPVLLDVLENGHQIAKLEAVRALAEIKDTRAIPGLMKAYETGSAIMRYWAGLGLDNLGVGMIYLKPD